MVVKVVRVLLNYAIEDELRRDNPAHRIKLCRLGEHRAFEGRHARCSVVRTCWRGTRGNVAAGGAANALKERWARCCLYNGNR
jgi:hypothetical protein